MLERLKRLFRPAPRPPAWRPHPVPRRRSYEAAGTGRLLASWTTSSASANTEIREHLAVLRARSRDLARNNEIIRRFLRLVSTHVVGPAGVGFQSKVRFGNGRPDEAANRKIEEGWAAWTRRGSVEASGRLSWPELQRLAAETVARDGEVLAVLGPGPNPENLSLRLLEADHLPLDANDSLPGGRRLVMGVELDADGRPVAYHLADEHPGDETALWRQGGVTYRRWPADRVVHLYLPERPGQVRGVPWAAPVMHKLKMLAGYEEAELTAARVGASKMGFFKEATGAEYLAGRGVTDDGDLVVEVEPGHFERLPPGVEFQPWDPDYPSGGFSAFVTRCLHDIAAGLGVSYHSLTGDLSQVSYSSARIGSLEERDHWRALQDWFCGAFLDPVFRAWLPRAMAAGTVALPADQAGRFVAPRWYPRRWGWVDPLKDMQAQTLALEARLASRRRILAEQGVDFEELVEELRAERDTLAAAGLLPGNEE